MKISSSRVRVAIRSSKLALGLDTALVAAGNAIVLLLAGRMLPLAQLDSVAMLQLYVATLVAVHRASILSPALSAQRYFGSRRRVPLKWLWSMSMPVALVVGAIMPMGVPGSHESYAQIVLLCVGSAVILVSQDFVRFVLYSRDLTHRALLMDLVAVALFPALVVLLSGVSGWESLVMAWIAASFGSFILGLILLISAADHSSLAPVTLRATLSLGRWSGADVVLSSLANLVPMVITSLALASPLAALFRLMQTVMGPLNVVNSTFLTAFSLDSWRLNSLSELRRLHRRTIVASLVLLASTAIYLGLGFWMVISFTGVSSSGILVVIVVYSISAFFGALTTPLMAAANALGYQRVGLFIRVVVVAFAVSVSVVAAGGVSIPLGGPIGLTAVVSSSLGFAGWLTGYYYAQRVERRMLSEPKE